MNQTTETSLPSEAENGLSSVSVILICAIVFAIIGIILMMLFTYIFYNADRYQQRFREVARSLRRSAKKEERREVEKTLVEWHKVYPNLGRAELKVCIVCSTIEHCIHGVEAKFAYRTRGLYFKRRRMSWKWIFRRYPMENSSRPKPWLLFRGCCRLCGCCRPIRPSGWVQFGFESTRSFVLGITASHVENTRRQFC